MIPSVSSGIFCWMFNGLYSYKDLFLFEIRSIIGFLGALKKNSILLWIVSFAFDFLDVYYTLGWLFPAILLPFPAFPFVSPSLTLWHSVFDHVVLHFGCNFGLHCFGVSISGAKDGLIFSRKILFLSTSVTFLHHNFSLILHIFGS